MSNALKVEKSGGSLVVTFNRPEIRSPLSIAVVLELIAVVESLSGHQSVGKLVFTGRDDVFASGADLREIAQITGATAVEYALRGQRLMNAIASARQETVAAVNGYCFGGALDLAVSCRRRIASPDAVFSHPGANLGIMTGWGGTQRLPRLIGEAGTLGMLLTARRVGAEEALRLGLIDEISENPLQRALE